MLDKLTQVIDGKLCLSSAAMQEVFGVSRQALGNWAKAGCPKVKPGWWPLAQVVDWRGLAGSGKSVDDDGLSSGALKLKYEAELKKLQADALDLKNAVARGDYVARVEIVTELSRYFTELKRSLTGLSRAISIQVGPYVDPTTARRIERELADVIADALERMSAGEIYECHRRKKKAKKRKKASG